MIHDGPLWSGGEIVFERFNARVRSFGECFYRAVRTVANVTDDLMSRSGTLREETIAYALDLTLDQKLSRYLHLKRFASFPFSSVNTSSSAPSSFNVNVILLPLIDPV